MSNKGSEIYPRHRLHTLEPYYSRHVGAMTELPGKQEGLHSKSDIAEQLAWRDQAIEALKLELSTLRAREQLESAVVEAAIQLTAKVSSESIEDEDVGYELGMVNDLVDALLAHRALKGKDGNS